jgi:hypothetical protein
MADLINEEHLSRRILVVDVHIKRERERVQKLRQEAAAAKNIDCLLLIMTARWLMVMRKRNCEVNETRLVQLKCRS